MIPAYSRHARTIHHSANTNIIADLLDRRESAPDTAIVSGYVRTIRNQKNITFASIGDGSSLEPLQALLTPEQAQRQVPQFLNFWACTDASPQACLLVQL